MKYTNESGRSMVEMLGVLAIVGVLSVGGIAGYTRAMRSWRANEILDAANRVAAMVETELGTANGDSLTYTQMTNDAEAIKRIAGGVVQEITAYSMAYNGNDPNGEPSSVHVALKSGNADVAETTLSKLSCTTTEGENPTTTCYISSTFKFTIG